MRSILLAASVAVLALTGSAMADDMKKGEKVFKKCKACHAVGEGAKNKVGPQLNGIIGRKAGAIEGFKYSKAMMAKAEGDDGLVWTVENLDGFLKKPKKFLDGKSKMTLKVKKDKQRADVILYLGQFNEDGTIKAAE